jgi:hypothetical protein
LSALPHCTALRWPRPQGGIVNYSPPLEQSQDALRWANEVRRRRSVLKAELRMGEQFLSEALLSEQRWMQGMRIYDLLLAVPWLGKAKARRILKAHKLSQTARLRNLSATGKQNVIRHIAERYPAVPLGEQLYPAEPSDRSAA